MVLLGKGSASCYVFKPSLEWPPPADLRCHSSVVRNSGELSAKCSRPLRCDQPLAARLPNFALQLLSLSWYKTQLGGNRLHVMLCKGRWRRYLQTACLSVVWRMPCSGWGASTFSLDNISLCVPVDLSFKTLVQWLLSKHCFSPVCFHLSVSWKQMTEREINIQGSKFKFSLICLAGGWVVAFC